MIGVYEQKIDGVWFGVVCDDEKVFATNFGSDKKTVLQGLLNSLPSNTRSQQQEKDSVLAKRAFTLLKEVYDGKGASHSVPFAMEHLSSYTRRVLNAVLQVPPGYVTFYGAIARVVGGSGRAVGRVMALNPFAPIVPCHRIVGSDFNLRGYGGGLDAKAKFLEREKQSYKSKREIVINGKKLVMFPAELALEKARKRG